MRGETQRKAIDAVIDALGREATGPGAIYLVGGATALICGWRDSTIDIDLKLAPEPPGVFGAIARLKDGLGINIELASPDMFVPPLPGWQGRSPFIKRVGLVDFYHYDFYSQAFAKLARGNDRDLSDVAHMLTDGVIEPKLLLQLVMQVVSEIPRYPHLNAQKLVQRIEQWVADAGCTP